MNCHTATNRISIFLDGRLPLSERLLLNGHLEKCPQCSSVAHQIQMQRATLRAVPARPVPDYLTVALRVAASRARVEQSRKASFGAAAEYWGDRARLWMQNLMRPVALPVAGGLLSAIFLFAVMSPMYMFSGHQSADVPTTLTRPATLKSSANSFGLIDTDIIVDVWVDADGRLMDYTVPDGQPWAADEELRRRVESALLGIQFEAATMFGVRKSGKLRITLSHNQMEVSG